MMSLLSFVKPLAYLSVPVFLLRTASNSSPLARYYVRLGLYLSTMGVCSIWGILVSIGMTAAGKRFDINWVVARSFYHLASRVLGIYVEVEGEEHLLVKPAILVANHQSMLDILYTARVFPKQASITSKKELQWMPLLGQYMTLSGAIFIDRKNNARAIKSVADAGLAMKQRQISVWVYPEGTRTLSEKSDLLPFKKGAFHMAVQAGVPITPIICQNYWNLYHGGTFESGIIKVKVLPPIPTAGLTASDVGELTASVREKMLAALHEISGDATDTEPSTEAKVPTTEEPKSSQEPVEPSPADASTPRAEPAEEIPDSPAPATSALAVDTSTPQQSRRNGSDRGPETESDDGMVLVDRPETPSDARGF